MPSKPKFRQSFEQQQNNQADASKGFQQQGKDAAKKTDADNRAGYENQQNEGQWGEDRANAGQNTTDTDANNSPVNQSGREVPFEDDTPRADPEKAQANS